MPGERYIYLHLVGCNRTSESLVSRNMKAATGWTVWGSNPVKKNGFFSLFKHPGRLWGRRNLVFSVYEGSFPGLNRSGRDVNHLPSSNAEIDSEWTHTSALLICLHSLYGETFTFTIKIQTTLGDVN
jgi:hypothetical protein